MKYSALVLTLAVGSAGAFTTSPPKFMTPTPTSSSASTTTTTTSLNAVQGENGLIKALVTGFAGLTFASQMAFAEPLLPYDTPQLPPPQEQVSIITPSSIVVSGTSFDTMDFSLPSYGDAVSGGTAETTKTNAAATPPAFVNPFPEVLGSSSSSSSSEAKPVAETKQAAEEAKKAAAQKAEDAAAKKAEEKAARRAAEAEKQKEMVARAAEKAKADAASAPVVPQVKAPEVKAPEFKAPEFKAPEFKAPDISSFKAPDVPKFDTSSFKAPDMPKFDTSSFKAPDMPKFDTSSFKAPNMPKFDMPKTPPFDASSIKVPTFSSPEVDKNLEPQGVRDDKARAARVVYLQANDDAHDMEEKARAVRRLADEKKELAKEAKDVACQTHWGGKLLCLRPFNSGY